MTANGKASTKQRVPRVSLATRAIAKARAALDKDIGRLERLIAGIESKMAPRLVRLREELETSRALLRQITAPAEPSKPGASTPPVARSAAHVAGEPQDMWVIIDWLRGAGFQVETLEVGKRYKLNRILATREDLVRAANRDRKQRKLTEFSVAA